MTKNSKKTNKKQEESKDLKIQQEETEENTKEIQNSEENITSFKPYLSYKNRLIFYIVLFLIFLILGIQLIMQSMDVVRQENISYDEEGTIDYEVCLNDNEFYEQKCLNKDMSYIASLIHNIPLKFHYQFTTNKDEINKGFEYEIIGKLVISDSENASKYFEKTYVLEEKTKDNVAKDGNYYKLDKQIDIDYDYYNSIATKFKSQYGVDTNSYLEVYLVTYNGISEKYGIPATSTTSISIPLSQKTVQIKMDSKGIKENNNTVVSQNEFTITNGIYLTLGILSTILSIVYIIFALRLLSYTTPKKNTYDKTLNKILKEYDRLIVETKTMPNLDDYNLLKITEFGELLDVRDNLRLPIMHYVVTEHQKSHFYILQDKNLYVYTLKAVDLKESDKSENKKVF